MSDGACYEVCIRHNVVEAIRQAAPDPDRDIPGSRLEVSAQLARNHLQHGCVDGTYLFDDAERARSFAVLALDFVKRVVEKRIEAIEALDTGAAFEAPAPGSEPPG